MLSARKKKKKLQLWGRQQLVEQHLRCFFLSFPYRNKFELRSIAELPTFQQHLYRSIEVHKRQQANGEARL